MYLLRFINFYSIDVALGAVVSSMYFAHLLNVDLSVITSITLGLTVWAIYTFDHLVDAANLEIGNVSKRHLLHRKYKRTLSKILIVVLLSLSFLIFLIPTRTVVWGGAILSFVLVYFIALSLLKQKFGYFKELLIAIIYTLGIVVGPVSIAIDINSTQLLIIISFAILAFLNLLIFSWHDRTIDRSQKFASIVISIGELKSILLLKLGFVTIICICAWIFLSGHIANAFLLLLMSMLLGSTLISRLKLKENQVYRIVGDGIFLLPLLWLL